MKPVVTEKLRTWYGLALTLRLYGTRWATIGPLPPHPQLVNMVLRMGLAREDSLHLQVLHELGHLQSLPIMAPLGVVLFLFSYPWLPSLFGFLACWEVLSEGYVILREGRNYLRIYGITRD